MSTRLLARGILDTGLGAGLCETRPAVAARLRDVQAAADSIDGVAAERDGRFPPAILADLFDAGLFTLTVPAALGGAGATMLEFCRAVALVAERDAALAVTTVPHLANGVLSVALFGDAAQREEVLGGIARRRSLVAFALTEAHTGSDVASHRSRIARDAGALRLDGSKTWITNVPLASHVVVVAKCPDLSPIKDGSAFVLVRPEDPGFGVGRAWQKLAVNASPTVDLRLDAVPLEPSSLVGRPGLAMAQFGEVVIWGRLGAAAAACGLLSRVAAWSALVATTHPAAARLSRALRRREVLARATLEVTAVHCAVNQGAERETATALCKIFCTRSADEAARAAWTCSRGHSGGTPRLLAQSVLEAAVFKVLEGPNEVLGHRAAIDLVAGLRSPAAELPRTGLPPLRAAAQLAAAFHDRIAPLAESAIPLSTAPVQEIAGQAAAAWASACGAAWLAQPGLAAAPREHARDAVAAFSGTALRLLRHRSAGGFRPSGEEEV